MIPYETNSYGLKAKLFQNPTRLALLVLGLLSLVLIFLVVVVFLLLPPVSLLTRLDPSYARIDETGGDVQDPDGTLLTFPSEGVQGPFRVKLTAVPRNLFLEGSGDSSLVTAAQSIPPNLVIKSPFYRIQSHGSMPTTVVLDIPIPNEAEPYRTLDLYSWNGTGWEWLPSRLLAGEGIIEAKLDYLPKSAVVMQTQTARPKVSVTYTENDVLPAVLGETSLEINPLGLYLEADGLIAGYASQLSAEFQGSTSAVVPIIRNWHDDGTVRSDLIDNLLINDEAQELHVGVILNLIQSNNYRGIGLDYREINPDLRQEYTSFLRQLRASLPADTQLLVYVAPPLQVSADTWDDGAYDWQTIGRIADNVLLPALSGPGAYEPGGQMEAMLDWAVGQVNRYKLQLYIPTRSLNQAGGRTMIVSYAQARQALGTVGIVGGMSTVNAGETLNFTLSGLSAQSGLEFDRDSGLYSFSYMEGDLPHTIYLENAASLARKLQLVVQYNLRGVVVQNLFEPNGDPQSYEVLNQFINLFIPPVEGTHAIVWRVSDQAGGLVAEQVVDLTAPTFQWAAPAAGGTYQVIAALSFNQDPTTATPLGSVQVTVNAP